MKTMERKCGVEDARAKGPDRIDAMLPLMTCPACREGLKRTSESLVCIGCSTRYPIHAGRPVFIPAECLPPKIMPADHISNQPPTEVLDWLTWLKGWVLNVGAGGTAIKLENVIETEFAIFRNTDVSADAHHLPFADGVFEAVVTFNTFEHLADPERAASEILRVLKPGGKLFLHTAFLQPVHEAPYHFYNTTEYGLQHWFRSFEIDRIKVSDNFNPHLVLSWLAATVLHNVEASQGLEARAALAKSTLGSWQSEWVKPTGRANPLVDSLLRLPQELQKQCAAGFQLEAHKRAA